MIAVIVLVCLDGNSEAFKHTKHVDVEVDFIVDRGSINMVALVSND